MKCKHSKYCKYYDKDSHTCNDDLEGDRYCGIYNKQEEIEVIN